MGKFLSISLLLLALSAFQACTKPAVAPDLGYDYFPLEIGSSRIYQVDSVIYDPNGQIRIDTVSFQLKESIADSYQDDTGLNWFRIERFERETDQDPWQFHSISAASRDETRAFRKENNLQFISFVFPQDIFAKWESTVFIDPLQEVVVAGEPLEMFKYWESGFRSIDAPYTLGTQTYPSTCEVFHAEFENLIELRRVREVYAKDTGLIYRELYILDTQIIDGTIPWEIKGEKGFILRQSLIAIE
ncbi:MAG: hypothetical protein KDC34_07650 [Saprospiraceae bacterium]|nr:hypothetical protein [Saprospiraceae bacterium]